MADATKKDYNAMPITGLAIVTLLVRKTSKEHLMNSKIGACLELSKFIPMMVREVMTQIDRDWCDTLEEKELNG